MSRNDGEIFPNSGDRVALGNVTFSLETNHLTDADGKTVPLRNRSAEVLAYLVRHAGQLVSKQDIFDHVWTDVAVTDDSLVQCIGDIRRAIGDVERQIVETVSRKGYRLNLPNVVTANERAGSLSFVLAGVFAAVVVIGLAWYFVLSGAVTEEPNDRPTIAVLPFDDFSVGADQGYLSDAIAEGIITELARFPLISAIARNSSFRYRDGDTDVRDIGAELGAHYVLEGSKQKSGDDLRVTVQLINARDGTHVWSNSYDQKIGDLFTVQDEIIKTVANRIGVRIERPVPGYDPERVTALNLHLQGVRRIRESFNAEAVAAVIDLNTQAIEADPDAPFGYIGLAHGYRAAATFGWLGMDREEALRLGFSASDRALEIAPNNSDVHYSRARLQNEAGLHDQALASYTKAIELNPSASNYLVASTTPLLYVGETELAISRLEQAMGIDPFHEDWYHWQMGWALWEIEDCQGALDSMLRMKKIRRGAHRMLAGIHACLGNVEEAQAAYKVFYAEANEPTISEQRAEWIDIWTAPGSLERFLDHMRIAGMKD